MRPTLSLSLPLAQKIAQLFKMFVNKIIVNLNILKTQKDKDAFCIIIESNCEKNGKKVIQDDFYGASKLN